MTPQDLSDYLEKRGAAETAALMDKLGFSGDFVAANVLAGEEPVTVSRIAMLWMGMPNKHDRKRVRQLFDALTQVGLLTPQGDEETWLPVGQPA
jgi:hypothetical protein